MRNVKIEGKNKPLLVFSTPRAGSSIFLDGVFRLAYETLGYRRNLYEFFLSDNIIRRATKEMRTRESFANLTQKGEYFTDRFEPGDTPQLLEEKFEILQALAKDKHLMKVFPNQINEGILNYLNENYHFICLERRDKLDQIWSFGWACATGKWDTKNLKEMSLETKSVRYDPDWFANIIEQIKGFHNVLAQLKSYDLYFYEDLNFRGIQSPYHKLNYSMGKSMLFKNRNEVIEWYEKEFKQKVSS